MPTQPLRITFPFPFTHTHALGHLVLNATPAPLPQGSWYIARQVGDGLEYRFPAGTLTSPSYLTADFILDGNHLTSFTLFLQEGDNGPVFGFNFGLLNQCQARLRMPLIACNQNRWTFPREGALLKPRCRDSRVDPSRVDRMRLVVERKSASLTRWCMTPITATIDEPAILDNPILPTGPLLDELGQSTLHQWAGKSKTKSEVIHRLHQQLNQAPEQKWPDDFSAWGGWRERKSTATGWFHTHHDGSRWWLVDPDGYLFWSIGMDCVRVDTTAFIKGIETSLSKKPEYNIKPDEFNRLGVNFLENNLVNAFGEENYYQAWSEISISMLKKFGFNTVANWSDWQIASTHRFPYVRPLYWPQTALTPMIYRDFPDVFHPEFANDAKEFAMPLKETAEDPTLIGYFLMNEPTWAFANETPASGMLLSTPSCYTRQALANFLRVKYRSDSSLSDAWGITVNFNDIAEGTWLHNLNEIAQSDLTDFSAVMVDKYFTTLSLACRQVDPNHLNLGVRYYTIPPFWALDAMRHFDVFSMNCYRECIPEDEVNRIHDLLHMPTMIGEWHFGALDVGLPASGIGHVPNQVSRGKAYRYYVENAACQPNCIGTHYFILYDQSALGRFDGENYNIGFLDVCNRPYEELTNAARLSHEVLYKVASGKQPPYFEKTEYLPLLFL
jgi:hypothetical protein